MSTSIRMNEMKYPIKLSHGIPNHLGIDIVLRISPEPINSPTARILKINRLAVLWISSRISSESATCRLSCACPFFVIFNRSDSCAGISSDLSIEVYSWRPLWRSSFLASSSFMRRVDIWTDRIWMIFTSGAHAVSVPSIVIMLRPSRVTSGVIASLWSFTSSSIRSISVPSFIVPKSIERYLLRISSMSVYRRAWLTRS